MVDNNKILLIGDQHIEARNGSEVWRQFFKKYLLEYTLPYCKAHNITHIISMGDLLDIRRSLLGEDMYWLVKEFIPMLADLGITWHQIQGNHSQIRRDSNELTWDDWLARESYSYGKCVKAYTKPRDLTLGDTTFAMLPWVNSTSHDLTVDYINNTGATIALGHLELAGFSMGGKLCEHGTLNIELLSKFDKVFSGHFHQESFSGAIKYLGTPYDLTWQDYNDCSVKGIYTFDTLSHKLDFIENSADQTLFKVIPYNYQDILENNLEANYLDKGYLENVLHLKDKVIRVEVVDRTSSSHYKSFLSAMRLVSCVNFTTLDLTREVETYEVDATPDKFKTDTLEVLLDKIDITEDIDNESVAIALKKVYSSVVEKNNLI